MMIRNTSAGLPEPDTRSGSAWRVLALALVLVLVLAAASAMAQTPAPEHAPESVTVSDAAEEDAGDAGSAGAAGGGKPDGEDAGSEDEALVIEPAESFDPTEEVDEDYSIPFPVDI